MSAREFAPGTWVTCAGVVTGRHTTGWPMVKFEGPGALAYVLTEIPPDAISVVSVPVALTVGAKVSDAGGLTNGTVLAIDGTECWVRGPTGGRSTYSVSALHVIAPAPLCLQEGGIYQSRDGRKVGPVKAFQKTQAKGPDFYTPHEGGFRDDGTKWNFNIRHPLDLVAEWTDEAGR